MLLSPLMGFFSSIDNRLISNIFMSVEAMLECCSANTSQIALALTKIKDKSFKTCDMWFYRLLGNEKFKVGELIFRCYINMIMAMLRERGKISYGDTIYIKIDFTSDECNFLILFASIIFSNKSIPLYFSMRNYPKKKGQYDHKKPEAAFINALKHYLSDRYKYVIIADRGFGNQRFFDLCNKAGFGYIIRIVPNLLGLYPTFLKFSTLFYNDVFA